MYVDDSDGLGGGGDGSTSSGGSTPHSARRSALHVSTSKIGSAHSNNSPDGHALMLSEEGISPRAVQRASTVKAVETSPASCELMYPSRPNFGVGGIVSGKAAVKGMGGGGQTSSSSGMSGAGGTLQPGGGVGAGQTTSPKGGAAGGKPVLVREGSGLAIVTTGSERDKERERERERSGSGAGCKEKRSPSLQPKPQPPSLDRALMREIDKASLFLEDDGSGASSGDAYGEYNSSSPGGGGSGGAGGAGGAGNNKSLSSAGSSSRAYSRSILRAERGNVRKKSEKVLPSAPIAWLRQRIATVWAVQAMFVGVGHFVLMHHFLEHDVLTAASSVLPVVMFVLVTTAWCLWHGYKRFGCVSRERDGTSLHRHDR